MNGFGIWLVQHLNTLFESLGRLFRRPIDTLVIVTMLAISIALPMALYIGIKNAEVLAGYWDGRPRISAILNETATHDDAIAMIQQLSQNPQLSELTLISPDDALNEVKDLLEIERLDEQIDTNPLPFTISFAWQEVPDSREIEDMRTRLENDDRVRDVLVDIDWVRRLGAAIDISRRLFTVFTILMALGMVIIVGNSVRLQIAARRDEIEVSALLGATRSWIRRPFLYGGALIGLVGAVCATIIVELLLRYVTPPIDELAELYGTNFHLLTFASHEVLLVALGGALLGWLSAFVTVTYYLKQHQH